MKNDIIQKDGKYYRKCRVVMLPATHSGQLYFDAKSSDLNYTNSFVNKTNNCNPQHLYILSGEEIKRGDWFYDGITIRFIDIDPTKDFFIKEDKKIIATTDESLLEHTWNRKIDGFSGDIPFPRPSNEFLQAYCKDNGKINDVLVEVWNTVGADTFYELKVAPDNTITIKKAEERMYSKQDIENYKTKIKSSLNLDSSEADLLDEYFDEHFN